ncbi:MAG: hypothetical protein F4X77_01225 [Acidobacteriia bacterium]|nr:hypothetical protein [Terriglobia bacterium]
MSKNNRQGPANMIAFIGLSPTVTIVIHSLMTGKETFPPRFGWIAKHLETLRNNPTVADHN